MKANNMNRKDKGIRDFKFLIWTIIAGVINSIALSSFSIPGKLYPGGFSGIARISNDLLEDFFGISNTFSVIYLSLNLFVALFVFKKIGKRFTIFSLIHITIVSLLTPILKPLINVDDMLLIAVFGGIMAGFSAGIALQHNSSSGGTDFLGVYLSTKYNRSSWNQVLYMNIAVLACAGAIYGLERALYSIIWQFCSTEVVKKMHKKYRHQTITIITKKQQEVSDAIIATTNHSLTKINAEGAYLKKQESYLYTIVSASETDLVVNTVLEIDPNAFINIQDSKSVVGNFYQRPLD